MRKNTPPIKTEIDKCEQEEKSQPTQLDALPLDAHAAVLSIIVAYQQVKETDWDKVSPLDRSNAREMVRIIYGYIEGK